MYTDQLEESLEILGIDLNRGISRPPECLSSASRSYWHQSLTDVGIPAGSKLSSFGWSRLLEHIYHRTSLAHEPFLSSAFSGRIAKNTMVHLLDKHRAQAVRTIDRLGLFAHADIQTIRNSHSQQIEIYTTNDGPMLYVQSQIRMKIDRVERFMRRWTRWRPVNKHGDEWRYSGALAGVDILWRRVIGGLLFQMHVEGGHVWIPSSMQPIPDKEAYQDRILELWGNLSRRHPIKSISNPNIQI